MPHNTINKEVNMHACYSSWFASSHEAIVDISHFFPPLYIPWFLIFHLLSKFGSLPAKVKQTSIPNRCCHFCVAIISIHFCCGSWNVKRCPENPLEGRHSPSCPPWTESSDFPCVIRIDHMSKQETPFFFFGCWFNSMQTPKWLVAASHRWDSESMNQAHSTSFQDWFWGSS